MTETDQETTSTEAPVAGDIAETPGGEVDGASLVVAISRGAGVVVRSVSDGLQNVADAFRLRKPPPKDLPEVSMSELLEQLGAIVAEHGAGAGYASLEEKPEFWRLVAKLRMVRRKQIAARTRERPLRKRRKVEEAVIERDQTEPKEKAAAPEESTGRKKKKKKAEVSGPPAAPPEPAAEESADAADKKESE